MSCFSLCFRERASRVERRTVEVDEEVSGIQNTNLFKYQELRLATENFSQSNKIGRGGYGSVYKGTLRDGTLTAVKVLSADSRQGVREFLTEINVIAEIEHENLVKLYGCCVEDHHRILVYGYLENNSLAQTLLGGSHINISFSWDMRRKICIGVAKGLSYLHEEVRPHIIHRDIKASNILLDVDFTPKISDFGLAKLFPPNMTHVSTRVAGTTGYLAPEYAIRGHLTRKADIYSYGVLLLEIVTGRNNTNSRLPDAEQYLLEKVWELYEKGELKELFDTSMEGDYDDEEVCNYMKIGLLCTQHGPKLRPSMSTVVKMLNGEIDVNEKEISKPGLIPEFMKKRNSSSGTVLDSSSSSGTGNNVNTSHATMTFTSIDDRSG